MKAAMQFKTELHVPISMKGAKSVLRHCPGYPWEKFLRRRGSTTLSSPVLRVRLLKGRGVMCGSWSETRIYRWLIPIIDPKYIVTLVALLKSSYQRELEGKSLKRLFTYWKNRKSIHHAGQGLVSVPSILEPKLTKWKKQEHFVSSVYQCWNPSRMSSLQVDRPDHSKNASITIGHHSGWAFT